MIIWAAFKKSIQQDMNLLQLQRNWILFTFIVEMRYGNRDNCVLTL